MFGKKPTVLQLFTEENLKKQVSARCVLIITKIFLRFGLSANPTAQKIGFRANKISATKSTVLISLSAVPKDTEQFPTANFTAKLLQVLPALLNGIIATRALIICWL